MPRLTILLFLSISVAFGQKVHIPPVSRDTLANGLTVILMEYRKVPLVDFRLMVKGGSAEDPEDLSGVGSMMASLMREGTLTRSSTEISEAIDFIGGSLSVGAGLDYCAATMEVMKKDVDTGLELFSDVILHPSFPDDETDRERKQRLARLDALKEEPSAIASTVFSRRVYGGHPYGRQAAGTKASLKVIRRDDLVASYRNMFLPNNAVLAVVGDFEAKEMFRKLKERFEGWERGARKPLQAGAPRALNGRHLVLVNKPDATQTQIRVGNTGIDIRNPDLVPLQVANTIFGGGFTSRLVEELRVKRSLTYGASSGFPASLLGGTYVISTFTKNETITETIDVLLAEVARFRNKGCSKEEMVKAQNYLAGSFARSLQSPEALASRLTDIELYGFPKDYLERYIERIRSVKQTDIERVVKERFLLDDLLMVLVTPADETVGKVQHYGQTTAISLDDAVE
jgi:zinc protease